MKSRFTPEPITNNIFDRIEIEDSVWKQIKQEHLQSLIENLVKIIEHFYVNSILNGDSFNSRNIRSAKGKHTYKIRVSKADRIAFRITTDKDNTILTISRIFDHAEGERLHKKIHKFKRLVNLEVLKLTESSINQEDILEIPNSDFYNSPFKRVWSYQDVQRFLKREDAELMWMLSDEQNSYLNKDGPILLKGTAGSGKTLVALCRLIATEDCNRPNRLYLTLTSGLKEYAQKSFSDLVETDQYPEFMTIEEVCLKIIEAKNLNAKEKYTKLKKMDFLSFSNLSFVKRACSQARVAPFVIWEEIRSVLKQLENQNELRQQYMQLEQDKNIVDVTLKVYLKYCAYLKKNVSVSENNEEIRIRAL
jgi:hypothetical protein